MPTVISLQKYLMGDEGNTGVNEKTRNREGTWGTCIAISPISDPRQSLINHSTLNSHQAWTWLQKPHHSVLVGHYWSNGTGPGDKVYLQHLIQKECKLTTKESGHTHSFSEFINVCEIWGKNPLGSSNLFGSLTPLMVSVSGHLIKILKVKCQIHPVLIFYGSGNCIRLTPHQAQNPGFLLLCSSSISRCPCTEHMLDSTHLYCLDYIICVFTYRLVWIN